MLSSDARAYVGRTVNISYTDRTGKTSNETTTVYEFGFLPVGGPCLITDVGEIRLDRILSCSHAECEPEEAF